MLSRLCAMSVQSDGQEQDHWRHGLICLPCQLPGQLSQPALGKSCLDQHHQSQVILPVFASFSDGKYKYNSMSPLPVTQCFRIVPTTYSNP